MAYRMKTEGLKETIDILKELGDQAYMVASIALYDGAGVIADEIDRQAKTIRTAPFHYVAVEGTTKRLPSPEEKAIVTESSAMGIAKFRKRLGAVDTSVGYNNAGYAHVKWNHMRSTARTNYKLATVNGREINASSTLAWIRRQGGSARYGLSPNIGKGAQNMKPIGVIANAINSGTSFMEKQPFVRRAVRKAESKAVAAIISKAEEVIEKITNGNNIESGGKSA